MRNFLIGSATLLGILTFCGGVGFFVTRDDDPTFDEIMGTGVFLTLIGAIAIMAFVALATGIGSLITGEF